MALEDVASSMRDRGDLWQGYRMAILLIERGYEL
jgi:hypothetical protein